MGVGGRDWGRGRGRGVFVDYRRKWEGLRFIFCWFNMGVGLLSHYPLIRSEEQRELLSHCLRRFFFVILLSVVYIC